MSFKPTKDTITLKYNQTAKTHINDLEFMEIISLTRHRSFCRGL